MDFSLNEEQKSLVALMKEFCKREVDVKRLNELADKPIPPNATREDAMARIPWDIMKKAHDVGLRQIPVPKEYGGGGYGPKWVTLTALAEAAGYWGGQMGRLFTIPWKHCASLVTAPKSVQEEFFPAFMKNIKTMAAASISEPNHGTDIHLPYDEPGASGKCFAYKDGDEWVLNGDKLFCTAGAVSDYIIMFVRTDKEGPVTKSMTSFLVPVNTPGFSITRLNDFMGNEITSNAQFHLENCRIPDRLRTSPVNGAWKGMVIKQSGKYLHLVALLGEMQKIWEDMRDYTKTRVQGGKPIIQHPNVGMLIAEADVLMRTERALQYQYAWECENNEKVTPGIVNPQGWWYICYWHKKVVLRMVEIGMEVYGGMGPSKELSFERWVRLELSYLHGGSTAQIALIRAIPALQGKAL
jgi:alkylation response protein AidB-like acyl-CoA dehydrogenase